MRRISYGLAFSMLLLIAPPLHAAPVEQTIPLTFNASIAPGRYYFTFGLYTEATGGTPVWEEAPVAKLLVSSGGVVKHLLGSTTPFTAGTAGPVDFTKQLWVAPAVIGIRTFPRFKLPIAVYSLATAGLRVVPDPESPSLIGGHPENTIAAGVRGAVIGGGGIAADPLDPTKPTFNEVLGDYGAIVGGKRNKADGYSFLGGGNNNQATGMFSVLVGGEANRATGDYAAVLGGNANEASGPNATVLGGSGSKASGDHATAAGGCSNYAEGYRSFAAGEDAHASLSGMFVWSASDDSLSGVYEQDGHFPPASLNGGRPQTRCSPTCNSGPRLPAVSSSSTAWTSTATLSA